MSVDPTLVGTASGGGEERSREGATGLSRREMVMTVLFALVLAGVAAGIALATSKPSEKNKLRLALDHPRSLVKFNLVERSGAAVTESDLKGQILVVDFIFTSCSLSCRAVNDRMAEIQRLTRDKQNVRLVSLSVDPRTDTPAVLSRFADQFHADSFRWIFLTGQKEQVHALLETSFIPAYPDMAEFFPGGFVNTDRIILVDAQGKIVGAFNGLLDETPKAIVAEIERLQGSHSN
jgi:protein SCO1/2